MTNNFNSSKSIVSICSCSLIIDHIYGRSKKNVNKGDILLGATLGLWWEWGFKRIRFIQCTSILTHVLYSKAIYFSRSNKQFIILLDSSFRSWFNSLYLHQREIKLFPVMPSSNQLGFKSPQRNVWQNNSTTKSSTHSETEPSTL